MEELTHLVRELSREERAALIEAAGQMLRELERGRNTARGAMARDTFHQDGRYDVHAHLPAMLGIPTILELTDAIGQCRLRLTLFKLASDLEEESRRRADATNDGG